MYESFYGLVERPFDLTPNPRFLFMTQGHREALSTIQYGISGRKGLTLVIGPAGTGKTTLVHAALEDGGGEHAKAILLTNPTLSREEFFQFLGLELGIAIEPSFSKTRFLRELHAALLKRYNAGMVTALVVDEAQSMPDELLEELRLLENLETSSEKLLPVVLVAQVELAERLKQPAMQALKQRVALRASLAPLTPTETAAYVAERIRIAGGDIRTIFQPEAIAAIAQSSGGIPRNISVLCDNAMVNGFAIDERPIGVGIIAEVCRDFDLPAPARADTIEQFVAKAAALTTQPEPSRAFFPRPSAAPVMSSIQMSASQPPVETLMTEHVHEEPRGSLLARARRRIARLIGLRWLMLRMASR